MTNEVDETPYNFEDTRSPLRRLLDAKHLDGRPVAEALHQLSDDERASLLSIAEGRVEGATRGDRSKAIFLLSRVASDDAAAALARVVEDPREDRDLRMSAIHALGLMPAEVSESRLISQLSADDEGIRRGLIRGLGQVGRASALEALRALEPTIGGALQGEYLLARTLVAQRIGRGQERIRIPPPAPRSPKDFKEKLPVELSSTGPAELREVLADFDGPTYGLRLTDEAGFVAQIGRARWAILLDAEMAAHGLGAALNTRPRVAALLARRMPETGTFALQYIVLTQPAKRRVEMAVARPSGEVLYSGWLETEGDDLRFLVADVARAGTAPTLVSGHIGREGVEVESYASPRRVAKREVEPLAL
jgi:HEAT repeat protein